VRSLQRFLFLLGVTAVFVFLVLGLWSARHLSKPIENLTTMARAIADGDEHVKINVKTGAQDIMRLAESVNDMATSLIHRKEGLAQLNAELEQRVNARTAELNKANEELTLLARKDALTGLGNRFATNERLQIEFSRQRRNGRPYVVLLGDIDHFKAVNDTLGHEMGDQVLKFVAHTLAVSCRETDFVGRYGGEEFLVILPDTSLDSALHVAEKIRKAVEESPPPTGNRIGVGAVNAADENPEAADKRADENLYRAKELGRNRVASG
jgi:diguanylate cyclase